MNNNAKSSLYPATIFHKQNREIIMLCNTCNHVCIHVRLWNIHQACEKKYIYIYMFVVNFDALAQASDIRIERRQIVFLCWMQDSNPRSQTPIRQQTECLLTNRLSYRGSSYKIWTRQPVPMISKHSVHSTSLPVGVRTWLWRYTCLLLLISMLWHRQAIDYFNSCLIVDVFGTIGLTCGHYIFAKG